MHTSFFFVWVDIRYKKTESPFNEREGGGGNSKNLVLTTCYLEKHEADGSLRFGEVSCRSKYTEL